MAKRGQSKYMTHMRDKPKVTPLIQIIGRGQRSSVMEEHEANIVKAKTNAQKGKRGGDCNRTQCQRSNAWWYNKTMQAYYCGNCAGAINESCLSKDHIASFGSMIYVNPPAVKLLESEEACEVVVTTADGTESVYAFGNTKQDGDDSFLEFCHRADLRGNGTPPFHYGELRDRMIRIRGLIQERYPNEELVEFV